MIEAWLDLPFWLLTFVTLLFWLGSASSLWWLFHYSRLAPFWHSCLGIVPPFFGSIAILFGLSVGFMGADIWQRADKAQQAVLQEASNLSLLIQLAHISEPLGSALKMHSCAYSKAVVQKEWPIMMSAGGSISIAEAELPNLLTSLTTPELSTQIDTVLRREMLNAVNQIRQYRIYRIQLSGSHSHVGKWIMVMFLGFMTQIAIFSVHLDKPRASALAQSIFALAMATVLTLLAGMDQPFTPPFAVSDAPLAKLAGCYP